MIRPRARPPPARPRSSRTGPSLAPINKDDAVIPIVLGGHSLGDPLDSNLALGGDLPIPDTALSGTS